MLIGKNFIRRASGLYVPPLIGLPWAPWRFLPCFGCCVAGSAMCCMADPPDEFAVTLEGGGAGPLCEHTYPDVTCADYLDRTYVIPVTSQCYGLIRFWTLECYPPTFPNGYIVISVGAAPDFPIWVTMCYSLSLFEPLIVVRWIKDNPDENQDCKSFVDVEIPYSGWGHPAGGCIQSGHTPLRGDGAYEEEPNPWCAAGTCKVTAL